MSEMTLEEAQTLYEEIKGKFMLEVSYTEHETYFKEITHGSSRVIHESKAATNLTLLTAENNAVGGYAPNYLKALKLLHPDRPLYLSPPIEKLMVGKEETMRLVFCKIPNNIVVVVAPKAVNNDERLRGKTQ